MVDVTVDGDRVVFHVEGLTGELQRALDVSTTT
jgi:hypothetical protein